MKSKGGKKGGSMMGRKTKGKTKIKKMMGGGKAKKGYAMGGKVGMRKKGYKKGGKVKK